MFAKQNCVKCIFSKVSPFRACGDAGRARDCEAKKWHKHFLVKVFAKQKSLFIYAGIIIGDRNGAFVGRS